ncbi:hypothetical protein BC833DRAFT_659768 [Globomyces pollinis-pini]|nr:hypothetical protein BC833DRAFT_659768 [Globomyces pollinis-pini]
MKYSLGCRSTEIIETVVMKTRNSPPDLVISTKKLPFWASPDCLDTDSCADIDSSATAFEISELPTESGMDSSVLGSKRVIIDQLLDGRKALVDKSAKSKISQPKNYLYFRNYGCFGKLKSSTVDQNTLQREANITDLDYTDFKIPNLDSMSLNDDSYVVDSCAASVVYQTIAPESSYLSLQPTIDDNPQPILKKHDPISKQNQTVKFNDTVHLFPLFKPNDFVIPNPPRSTKQGNLHGFELGNNKNI